MKIANCLECGDLVRLHFDVRHCRCGKTGGRYLSDGLHAEYWGPARMLGMLNHEWRASKEFPPTRPYSVDYKWFVIGHWRGCHIAKTDAPELHNEYPQ